MVDASLVLDAIVAVSIAAGAFFAIIELRGIARDRRAHLVFELVSYTAPANLVQQLNKIIRTEFKDARDAEQQLGLETLNGVAAFFEGMGLMVRRGLVDGDLMLDFMIADVYWDHMRPWIMERRIEFGPSYYEHFEHLAELQRSRDARN